jgi:two-component system, NtrC family, sensor kinase
MQRTLGQRLFRSFALVIAGVGILIVLLSTFLVNRAAVSEAQRHVRLNLQGAWSIYEGDYLSELRYLVESLSRNPRIAAIASGSDEPVAYSWWDGMAEHIRPDIFTITDISSRVVRRGHAQNRVGDLLKDDTLIRQAGAGHTTVGTVVWSLDRLAREDSALAARAAILPRETHLARSNASVNMTPALMMIATAPVVGVGDVIVGTVQVGILLNRYNALVDAVKDVVFYDDYYGGKPMGTVTIFLGDVRVATNVRDASGERAIGTRVSEQVYNRVIRNGQSWVDRAFVVDEWYLSAYEPIYDINDDVVGILYVGLLEQPYRDLRTRTVMMLLGVAALGLIVSLLISWLLARRLSRPLHDMARATKAFSEGDLSHRVECEGNCVVEELIQLANAFNHMADTLDSRQAELTEANRTLVGTNDRLAALNHDYLDMLGFVSHELKNPLSSCLLNAHSLHDGILGDLTEHQLRATSSMVRNLKYFDEMVGHYLDLTRIEQGRLSLQRESVDMIADVIEPVIENVSREIQEQSVEIRRTWSETPIAMQIDPGLLQIVYGNLIGNAIKYGREACTIGLRANNLGDRWEFGVWNDGAGVPREHMGDLFQKFRRIQRPGQPLRKGTGLGLFVTREIVEQHGGSIRAESVEGRWIEFIIELPVEPIESIDESDSQQIATLVTP